MLNPPLKFNLAKSFLKSGGKEAGIGAVGGGVIVNIGKFGKIGQSLGKFSQRILQNTPIGPKGALNRGVFGVGIGNNQGDALLRIGLP